MTKQRELVTLSALPEGLLDLQAGELHTILSGPTLIHLTGRQMPAVFISVLLHGNEHTSWEAARQFLLNYKDKALPRGVSLFIGNVEAARLNQRYLEGQQDFNRMWGGDEAIAAPLMNEVIEEMRSRDVFLSIDIHNNTGKNPHYACINTVEPDFLYLASLFSRTVVYFVKPDSVQSMAFSKLCPSVTVECGLSGDRLGIEHALEYINACVHLSEFPQSETAIKDVIVYHTVAVAKIPGSYSLGFDDESCEINLNSEIEYFNFKELPSRSTLGRVFNDIERPITITNDFGECVSDEYLQVSGQDIQTKKPMIPAMITRDVGIIRKDCLCYLMEEYSV